MNGHISFLTLVLAGAMPWNDVSAQDEVEPEQIQFFERHIRPVLVKECYSCHSAAAEEIEGGLSLDTREGTRQGGDRGPAVVPGSPRRSLLIEAIRHTDDDLRMPPEKKLPAEVVANFEKWIAMGAPDPRASQAVVADKPDSDKYKIDMEKGRRHWAFQPPKKAAAPSVQDADWPRTDVDRFVLAALESKGLKPVGQADRRTLVRRLSFDLTGLPPRPSDMEALVGDESSAAFEAAVDRLLESSHFGEKWARHWLDVARYAESTGDAVNFYYPHAWRYRDYVIAAFNADKPYDQFIKEQLAGDLMAADDPNVTAERMIATGFLALGAKTLNERSGLKFELDVADEQIDVTTQAFLGITVACARCHDHKFDPIPQADYYAIAGIFRSTETCFGTVRYINAQRPSRLLPLPADANVTTAMPDLSDRQLQRLEEQIQSVRDSMREMRDGVQRFFAFGRISLLQARLDEYDDAGKPKLLAMGVHDKQPAVRRFRPRFGSRRPMMFGDFSYNGTRTIGDSPVYLRGEPDQPSDSAVPRGTLQVMAGEPLRVSSRSSGRLEFAEWIASRENPLAARVMVNRVWLQLFGRGLAPTADDFGMAGRPPTHPELLDHLAIRFMDDGWSVKQLIRYLVTSRVYQLSSAADPAAIEVDPENTLLWRMAPRRLDAECLRDSMLAVSGQLDTTPPVGSAVGRGGEGPVSRPFMMRDSILGAVDDPTNTHRSIYLPIIRDNVPEVLALFDAADPSLITSQRQQTTVASQGLFLLNNEFVMRAADAAADTLLQKESDEARIRDAFMRFFGRPPAAGERVAAEKFLAQYREHASSGPVPRPRFPRTRFSGPRVSGGRFSGGRPSRTSPQRESWSAFCQALFASAEFQVRK